MTNEKRIEEIKRGGASLTIFFTDGDEKRIDYDNQQGEYTRDEWREQLLSPVDIGGYGIESEEDVEGLLWYLEMSSNTGEFFAGEMVTNHAEAKREAEELIDKGFFPAVWIHRGDLGGVFSDDDEATSVLNRLDEEKFYAITQKIGRRLYDQEVVDAVAKDIIEEYK